VFGAKGVDSNSLGMKVGHRRPDVIILDDIEPDASNYSQHLAAKRLATLQNSILPLSQSARVIWSGTVTMEGSLIHQLVKTRTTTEDVPAWITDEKFVVTYYPAIVTKPDGDEVSIWPEKWSIEFLAEQRHTRQFALNFMNEPRGDADRWKVDDITIEPTPETALPRTIISIDPAVTKKNTSDFTGIAVLSQNGRGGRVYVRAVWKVKKGPTDLCHKVATIAHIFPEATVLLVETNQGGDLWEEVFRDIGLKYVQVKQSVKKEARADILLHGYQKRKVVHAQKLPALESELYAFPDGLNDDLVDAVGSGFHHFTNAEGEKKPRPDPPRTLNYA
jgi:phage terminase large subunit-like protein